MRLRGVSLWVLIVLLTGCEPAAKQQTPIYYLRHPLLLKTEMVNCQEKLQQGELATPYCDMIAKTTEQYFAMVVQQQRQPEAFGMQVLSTESSYGNAREVAQTAKQHLETLVKQGATPADITDAQTAYQAALTTENEWKEKMDILLAVLGESSPE